MRKFITKVVPILAISIIPSLSHADGEELYMKHCKKCHGEKGDGDTLMGKKLNIKDYTKADVQAEMTDEGIAKAIKEGLQNESGKRVMLAFGSRLSDEEVNDIVAYVRSFKKD